MPKGSATAGLLMSVMLAITASAQTAPPPPAVPGPTEPGYWLGTGLTAFIIGILGLAVLIAVFFALLIRRRRAQTNQ
jgi:heme/copper-type cytochrome/quinol oxidase subunit 2